MYSDLVYLVLPSNLINCITSCRLWQFLFERFPICQLWCTAAWVVIKGLALFLKLLWFFFSCPSKIVNFVHCLKAEISSMSSSLFVGVVGMQLFSFACFFFIEATDHELKWRFFVWMCVCVYAWAGPRSEGRTGQRKCYYSLPAPKTGCTTWGCYFLKAEQRSLNRLSKQPEIPEFQSEVLTSGIILPVLQRWYKNFCML